MTPVESPKEQRYRWSLISGDFEQGLARFGRGNYIQLESQVMRHHCCSEMQPLVPTRLLVLLTSKHTFIRQIWGSSFLTSALTAQAQQSGSGPLILPYVKATATTASCLLETSSSLPVLHVSCSMCHAPKDHKMTRISLACTRLRVLAAQPCFSQGCGSSKPPSLWDVGDTKSGMLQLSGADNTDRSSSGLCSVHSLPPRLITGHSYCYGQVHRTIKYIHNSSFPA